MSGGEACEPSDLSDETIPLVLTDPAATLAALDLQVRAAVPMASPTAETPPKRVRPALVLILGTGPCARAVLEAGAMPVELRADDVNSDTWTAGVAHLAERIDVLLATRDWNTFAAGRAAVLAAGLAGTPVFFEMEDFHAWFERWRVALEGAARMRARRSDGDELEAAYR